METRKIDGCRQICGTAPDYDAVHEIRDRPIGVVRRPVIGSTAPVTVHRPRRPDSAASKPQIPITLLAPPIRVAIKASAADRMRG